MKHILRQLYFSLIISVFNMKKFSRILGIDDGPFKRSVDKACPIIGVIYRFDGVVERIMARKITIDGNDATESIISMLSEYGGPVEAVVSEGVTFGGFNFPDPDELLASDYAYISYSPGIPDLNSMYRAMSKYELVENMKILRKYSIGEIETSNGKFSVNLIGIEKHNARMILQKTMINGKKCEPVRLAHLIGKAFRDYSLNM